jgi:hypothetical protein
MQTPPPVVHPQPQSPFNMDAKKQLQKSSNIKIAIGFVGQFSRLLIIGDPDNLALTLFTIFLLVVFTAVFVWGCCDYIRSKGYAWGYGFLGLVGCIGLVILIMMPDKWKAGAPVEWPTNYPRDPGSRGS